MQRSRSKFVSASAGVAQSAVLKMFMLWYHSHHKDWHTFVVRPLEWHSATAQTGLRFSARLFGTVRFLGVFMHSTSASSPHLSAPEGDVCLGI